MPDGDCKVGDRAALIEIIHGLFRDSLFTKTRRYAADTQRCTMFLWFKAATFVV